MKTENTLPLQGDLEKFVKGELAIHVQNSEEYVGLISQLEKSDVRLSNAAEYQKNRDYYDPRYQYYYMEDPKDLYMNANVKIENLMRYYNINKFVKYSALDFVKQPDKYVKVEDIMAFINSPNRGNSDYFIVDQIEELCGTKAKTLDELVSTIDKDYANKEKTAYVLNADLEEEHNDENCKDAEELEELE